MVFQSTAMWHDLSYLKVGKEAIQFISLFDDTVDIWSQEDIQLVEQDVTPLPFLHLSNETQEANRLASPTMKRLERVPAYLSKTNYTLLVN
jgi:hypothetical protein